MSGVACPYCGQLGHGMSYHDERKRRVSVIAAVLVAIALAGFAMDRDGAYVERVVERLLSDPGDISRTRFGPGWPLTVDEGTLACEGRGVVTFASGGTTYAVNRAAKTLLRWPDIDRIRADSPGGLKMNLVPLIDRGLALCE